MKVPLKREAKCPSCGAEAKAFGFFDAKMLFEEKSRRREGADKPDGRIEDPVPPSNNLDGGPLLGPIRPNSHSAKEQELIQLFRAIFEQNKIIIQQNELIYNMLKGIEKIRNIA